MESRCRAPAVLLRDLPLSCRRVVCGEDDDCPDDSGELDARTFGCGRFIEQIRKPRAAAASGAAGEDCDRRDRGEKRGGTFHGGTV